MFTPYSEAFNARLCVKRRKIRWKPLVQSKSVLQHCSHTGPETMI